jgi:hypothetical protein
MALSYAGLGSDRRKGIRVPQERGAKIFYAVGNRYIAAQTVDFSPSGLCITLPKTAAVIPGSTVSVHLPPKNSESLVGSKHLMASARVVWVTAAEGRTMVGLQYLKAQAGAAVSAA